MWQHGGVDGYVAGQLLVASPLLLDPNFFRSVVLILQHDEDGAVGVVLNRPSTEPVVDHLPEWAPRLEGDGVVFLGGPVEPEVAIGVVRTTRPGQPTPVAEVGMVDLGDDPAAANSGPIRVYSGYAGWGSGQLEAELAEGAWVVVSAQAEDVFTPDPSRLWSEVLRRQRGSLALLASFPPDPALN
ncbi:MAG TPA: YqgE/AlgH family protein [Acidimicrobiia bacterium]|nr:YqgE/AlgH family protein [Acidimicrobiia bacterium]